MAREAVNLGRGEQSENDGRDLSHQVHAHHHHPDPDANRQSPMLGPLQVPRQQQAQGQQQQVQQQPQQQQQQLQQQGDLLPPPQSGQDFTLSSVLHFLQTEWRRYERDRNEWEIERAEMRVCSRLTTVIGVCTWSRCSIPKFSCRPGLHFWKESDGLSKMSNLTLCAVSKCWSMRFVSNGTSNCHLPPASITSSDVSLLSQFETTHSIILSRRATDEIQRLARPERREGGQRRKLPPKRRCVSHLLTLALIIDFRHPDSALPQERISGGQSNGNPSSNPNSRPHTWAGVQLTNGPHGANLLGKPPPGRDPKSRARSREYLKQSAQFFPLSWSIF